VTVWRGRLAGVELPPLTGATVGETADASLECQGAMGQNDRERLEHWIGELEAYFRGERLSWTAEEIALDERVMSPFTRAVYETLLSVPAAVTVSYGALAGMAGFPRAARAVGTAMATNCIPIVVPCHRVIRSDGSLGRYGSDSSWKERLLAHERRYAGEGRGKR
jgi:methylated-DNA-[protein]-cysteine S-methyltransferase